MIIKWLGHASFQIVSLGKNIFIDPYAGEYKDKADIILITHEHRDHCDIEKITSISLPQTVIITSEACSGKLTGNVSTLNPGDSLEVQGIQIIGTESYNVKRFRSPGIPYHPESSQIGFIVKAEGKTVYHAGDADYLPSMKLVEADVALLPIDGTYTMDLDEAVEAALAINPKIVVPMHRRQADVRAFKDKVEGQSKIKVEVMSEGGELKI